MKKAPHLSGPLLDLETKFGAQALHLHVIRQDAGGDALELLVIGDLNELLHQLSPQPAILPGIGDDQGELRIGTAGRATQPPDSQKLMAAAFCAVLNRSEE